MTSISSILKSAFARVKSTVAGVFQRVEFQDVDAYELGRIAADLHLPIPEFRALVAKGEGGILPLKQRLLQFGLDEDELNATYPKVAHDLQRVCGNCPAAGKCTADFPKADSVSRISTYCPNTHTLEALNKELSQ